MYLSPLQSWIAHLLHKRQPSVAVYTTGRGYSLLESCFTYEETWIQWGNLWRGNGTWGSMCNRVCESSDQVHGTLLIQRAIPLNAEHIHIRPNPIKTILNPSKEQLLEQNPKKELNNFSS